MTEAEVVGWHLGLNGYEFEQAPGNSEGQVWHAAVHGVSYKESDTTEWLNNIRKHVNNSRHSLPIFPTTLSYRVMTCWLCPFRKRTGHKPACHYSIYASVVVQLFNHVWLFETPWTAARQAALSFTISQSLLKLMSIALVMPSNHLILCHPLLLLPSVFPSVKVFSNDLALHILWPKYWSFSFSMSLSNEHSGLISFRMDWFDLLASKKLSGVFSNTTVQKHNFFGTQPSFWSKSHIHTWLLEKP